MKKSVKIMLVSIIIVGAFGFIIYDAKAEEPNDKRVAEVSNHVLNEKAIIPNINILEENKEVGECFLQRQAFRENDPSFVSRLGYLPKAKELFEKNGYTKVDSTNSENISTSLVRKDDTNGQIFIVQLDGIESEYTPITCEMSSVVYNDIDFDTIKLATRIENAPVNEGDYTQGFQEYIVTRGTIIEFDEDKALPKIYGVFTYNHSTQKLTVNSIEGFDVNTPEFNEKFRRLVANHLTELSNVLGGESNPQIHFDKVDKSKMYSIKERVLSNTFSIVSITPTVTERDDVEVNSYITGDEFKQFYSNNGYVIVDENKEHIIMEKEIEGGKFIATYTYETDSTIKSNTELKYYTTSLNDGTQYTVQENSSIIKNLSNVENIDDTSNREYFYDHRGDTLYFDNGMIMASAQVYDFEVMKSAYYAYVEEVMNIFGTNLETKYDDMIMYD